VELVVKTTELPALFDALARQNFITVLDMRLSAPDPYRDLEQGYYYGSGPVSRVHLRLETLWFRAWTAPYMPRDVRDVLGIQSKPVAAQPAA
jgi:hypothetical protein